MIRKARFKFRVLRLWNFMLECGGIERAAPNLPNSVSAPYQEEPSTYLRTPNPHVQSPPRLLDHVAILGLHSQPSGMVLRKRSKQGLLVIGFQDSKYLENDLEEWQRLCVDTSSIPVDPFSCGEGYSRRWARAKLWNSGSSARMPVPGLRAVLPITMSNNRF